MAMSEIYAIVVNEELDERWAMRLEGLTITHDGKGITRIYGPVADQAALYGILIRLRDLGLTLISVNRLES